MREKFFARRLLALAAAVLLAVAMPLCARVAFAYDSAAPQALTSEDIVGKAAVLMDFDTGEVLFEKNAHRKTFPASTTKIMTCLVALEQFPNLNDLVTVGPESKDIPADSSKLFIRVGEQYPMIDLLYGMMMKSGNDASMTIAVAVAGSVSDFVELMNEKAQQLGCKDTHFANPHGYQDEAHWTTAYDMALIAQEAMKNRTFREIVSARSYTMSATSQREKWRVETSNSMFVATSKYYYPALIGIKTGYHSKAGRCFVGAAKREGMEMVSVVLKSKNEQFWVDTARLFDYGFTRYETMTFSQLFEQAGVYASIKNASVKDEGKGMVRVQVVPGTALDSYKQQYLPDHLDEVLKKFNEGLKIDYNQLEAPIRTGDILGSITMNVNGVDVTAPVIASRDVAAEPKPFTLESLMPGLAKGLSEHMLYVGIGILLLIILIIVLIRRQVTARERRRRKEMLRRRRASYERYRREHMR